MLTGAEAIFGGAKPLLDLIESIYAAAQREELWESVVKEIGDLAGSERSALFSGSTTETPALISNLALDEDAWHDFVQYYAAINPIMQRAENTRSPEATWFTQDVISNEELERTEFYTDFFAPNGMHWVAGLRLQEEGMPPANLSLQRSREKEAFGRDADVFLQTLRPHLLRSLSLRQQLSRLRERTLGLERAIEMSRQAVLALDAELRIVYASPQAEHLLDGKGVHIKNDRLRATAAADQRSLQQFLRSAAQPAVEARPSRSSILLRAGDTGRQLYLTALPFRRSVAGIGGKLAVLLFLSDPQAPACSRVSTLMLGYRMSQSEARLADLLASGCDLAEIAQTLRLTRETTRFYLKRIYAKTGTRRQAELVRLVLALPPE